MFACAARAALRERLGIEAPHSSLRPPVAHFNRITSARGGRPVGSAPEACREPSISPEWGALWRPPLCQSGSGSEMRAPGPPVVGSPLEKCRARALSVVSRRPVVGLHRPLVGISGARDRAGSTPWCRRSVLRSSRRGRGSPGPRWPGRAPSCRTASDEGCPRADRSGGSTGLPAGPRRLPGPR